MKRNVIEIEEQLFNPIIIMSLMIVNECFVNEGISYLNECISVDSLPD